MERSCVLRNTLEFENNWERSGGASLNSSYRFPCQMPVTGSILMIFSKVLILPILDYEDSYSLSEDRE